MNQDALEIVGIRDVIDESELQDLPLMVDLPD
jgi:hypothetical protein